MGESRGGGVSRSVSQSVIQSVSQSVSHSDTQPVREGRLSGSSPDGQAVVSASVLTPLVLTHVCSSASLSSSETLLMTDEGERQERGGRVMFSGCIWMRMVTTPTHSLTALSAGGCSLLSALRGGRHPGANANVSEVLEGEGSTDTRFDSISRLTRI